MATKKRKSRVLGEMHETALGLQAQQWHEAREDAVQHAQLLEGRPEEFRDLDPATGETEGAILSYDWEALRASRAEIQGRVSFQYDLVLYAERMLERIRAILTFIEQDAR